MRFFGLIGFSAEKTTPCLPLTTDPAARQLLLFCWKNSSNSRQPSCQRLKAAVSSRTWVVLQAVQIHVRSLSKRCLFFSWQAVLEHRLLEGNHWSTKINERFYHAHLYFNCSMILPMQASCMRRLNPRLSALAMPYSINVSTTPCWMR